jgi:ABC-type lipoprotein export system ATPase subunit
MDSTDPHLQAEINLVELLSKGLKNLKINREEAILIMGNSGGGKSTLCSIFLKMIL